MNKSIFWGIWAILGMGFVGLFYIAYLLLYPFKVIEIHQPYQVLTKKVESGTRFIYRADYCKYMDAPAEVSRTLYSANYFYAYPKTGAAAPLGCNIRDQVVLIPQGTPAGLYKFRIVAVFHINAVRSLTYTFETESFEITEAKEDDGETKPSIFVPTSSTPLQLGPTTAPPQSNQTPNTQSTTTNNSTTNNATNNPPEDNGGPIDSVGQTVQDVVKSLIE